MIIYSVEITIEAGIETEWLDWMKGVHVADVVRPGWFSESRVYKVVESAGAAVHVGSAGTCRVAASAAAEPSYVMQYHCRSLEEYHRYRDNFAPALQKEPSDRFAGRFRGSRRLLEEVSPNG